MKTHQKIHTVLTLALFLLSTCALVAEQNQAGTSPEVAVIVNPSNQLEDISTADLRKIFSGEKQHWSTGLPIFPMVRAPEAHERSVLLNLILRMSESEYKQHWVKKVYSGEVQREPLALLSNGMQLEGVRAERGGIALINLSDVRQGVKVLKVDGRQPGGSGYTLR
jgi:ABC-type phosphate transport system substrate-binding protein